MEWGMEILLFIRAVLETMLPQPQVNDMTPFLHSIIFFCNGQPCYIIMTVKSESNASFCRLHPSFFLKLGIGLHSSSITSFTGSDGADGYLKWASPSLHNLHTLLSFSPFVAKSICCKVKLSPPPQYFFVGIRTALLPFLS